MRNLISWALYAGAVVLFAYDLQNFDKIERFEMYYHKAFELALIVLMIAVAFDKYKAKIKNETTGLITFLILLLLLLTTFWEEILICNIAHTASYFYVFIILIIITRKNASEKAISH